ncbi:hypothetical protein BDY19DRAFT_873362, partial [Irpex rosettiformis]
LSPADICRLAKTTRVFRLMLSRNLSRLYSINRQLLRFFDDPSAFRILQAQTGAIISGSFALQFFTQTVVSEDDLDVYAVTTARSEIGAWLLANGYRYAPRPPYYHPDDKKLLLDKGQAADYATALEEQHLFQEMNHDSVEGVLNIMDFVRDVDGLVRKVQVHFVGESPLVAVMNFHSTMLMNFITYETAYCLYPKATLIAHANLI